MLYPGGEHSAIQLVGSLVMFPAEWHEIGHPLLS